MNIVFRITKNGETEAAEEAFLKESTSLGLTGLRGHRRIKGLRASSYNTITLEGAQKLADFIHSFAKA
jgi:phosphoserine aminotransferase